MSRGEGFGIVFRQRILSPQDLGDLQPRRHADDGQTIVFDGRLDDRENLARALGEPFHSDQPDSLWCAKAFEKWGGDAPSRLLGDFALAHWDARLRRLTLARDRTGQRSIYYHRRGSLLVFATTLRAMLALAEVPRVLDEIGLADFLALNPFDQVGTLYRDISRVPPAHACTFEREFAQSRQYWQLDLDKKVRLGCDADYVDAARTLLDRAVERQLRILGPIAVMTSGGLDSAGVAATAARQANPETVYAFTAIPAPGSSISPAPGKYGDERPYVAALLAMYANLRIETVAAIDPEPIETDARSIFAQTALPMRNVHGVAWFGPAWRRAAELGAKTLLTGDAGNMSLSYDGLSHIDSLREDGRWAAWAASVWQVARMRGASPVRALARSLVPRRRLPHGASAGWQHYSALDQGFAAEINLAGHFAEHRFDPAQPRLKGSYAERLSRMLEAGSLAGDGRSALRALTGLTMSDPLYDTELLQFCASIPEEQFLRHGQTRSLARRVLSDRLPTAILTNLRRGEQIPEWFDRLDDRRDSLIADVERLARSPIASRVLDVDRLKALVSDWPSDVEAAHAHVDAYRFALARGVHVGQFIRWVEGAND